MSIGIADFVLETSTNPGTGDFTLNGAPAGRVPFASAFSDSQRVFYFAYDGTRGEWGIGTLSTTGAATLARTTPKGNTLGSQARLNFTSTVQVYNEIPGAFIPILAEDGSLTLPTLTIQDSITVPMRDPGDNSDNAASTKFVQVAAAGSLTNIAGEAAARANGDAMLLPLDGSRAMTGPLKTNGQITNTGGVQDIYFGAGLGYRLSLQADGNAVWYNGSTPYASISGSGATFPASVTIDGIQAATQSWAASQFATEAGARANGDAQLASVITAASALQTSRTVDTTAVGETDLTLTLTPEVSGMLFLTATFNPSAQLNNSGSNSVGCTLSASSMIQTSQTRVTQTLTVCGHLDAGTVCQMKFAVSVNNATAGTSGYATMAYVFVPTNS